MRNTRFSDTIERALGQTGLFLMLVIARLAIRGYSERQRVARGPSAFLARRAIDVIAVVGWVADRLPSPAPHAAMQVETTRRRPPCAHPAQGIASRVDEWRMR